MLIYLTPLSLPRPNSDGADSVVDNGLEPIASYVCSGRIKQAVNIFSLFGRLLFMWLGKWFKACI